MQSYKPCVTTGVVLWEPDVSKTSNTITETSVNNLLETCLRSWKEELSYQSWRNTQVTGEAEKQQAVNKPVECVCVCVWLPSGQTWLTAIQRPSLHQTNIGSQKIFTVFKLKHTRENTHKRFSTKRFQFDVCQGSAKIFNLWTCSCHKAGGLTHTKTFTICRHHTPLFIVWVVFTQTTHFNPPSAQSKCTASVLTLSNQVVLSKDNFKDVKQRRERQRHSVQLHPELKTKPKGRKESGSADLQRCAQPQH